MYKTSVAEHTSLFSVDKIPSVDATGAYISHEIPRRFGGHPCSFRETKLLRVVSILTLKMENACLTTPDRDASTTSNVHVPNLNVDQCRSVQCHSTLNLNLIWQNIATRTEQHIQQCHSVKIHLVTKTDNGKSILPFNVLQ